MLIIKGQSNKVPLTLREKSSESDSEYIIKLTNDFSGEEKIFAVQEVSVYPDRASVFNVTESDTEDLENGVVSLSDAGRWTYTAYEMEISSPKNLDPDDAIGIVETGICDVFDDSDVPTSPFSEDEEKNSPVFK